MNIELHFSLVETNKCFVKLKLVWQLKSVNYLNYGPSIVAGYSQTWWLRVRAMHKLHSSMAKIHPMI